TINGGEAAQENGFVITPVEHASMVLNWDGTIIYVDPVGGKDVYNNYSEADMILVTDIHGDHMDIPTLEAIVTYKTVVFAPKSVFDKMPESLQNKTNVINN